MADVAETVVIILSWIAVVVTFPISLAFCLKVCLEFYRVVVFRNGRIKPGAKGPGRYFILPCIDTVTLVDMRTIVFKVPPQDILTSDSVSVAVDAVVYYKVVDASKALVNVADYSQSTQLLAASTIRNSLSTHDLRELLSDREAISNTIMSLIRKTVHHWGIEIVKIALKDVRLPLDLQRTMAVEAEASRESRAKIVSAEGEIKASEALTEASKILADNPMAIQLRYLQCLTSLTPNDESQVVIFPMPLEVLKSMM